MTARDAAGAAEPPPDRPRRGPAGYAAAAAVVAVAIALIHAIPRVNETTAALLLIVAVFLAAWGWQRGPGVLAALIASAGFNWFFLPPLHTFVVGDPRNVTSLAVFLAAALLVGGLSAVARDRLRQIESEREEMIRIQALAQSFLADGGRAPLEALAAGRLREALACDGIVIFLAGDGALARVAGAGAEAVDEALAERAFRQGLTASASRGGRRDLYLPIQVGMRRLGVLAAFGVERSERMAATCAALLGLAAERERYFRATLADEELRIREELKTTLLATVAHDLKTPLAVARVEFDGWLERNREDEAASRADKALTRLTRLVDELMKVIRIEAGAARPHPEVQAAASVVEAAVWRCAESGRRHRLVIEPPAADLRVIGDGPQIAEALSLGLENAVKYSPEGGEIRVVASRESGRIVFNIDDEGPGIPPDRRGLALGKFVRLEAGDARPGNGLGLYLAKSLAELNGGALRLDRSPGGGLRFSLEIPEAV